MRRYIFNLQNGTVSYEAASLAEAWKIVAAIHKGVWVEFSHSVEIKTTEESWSS